MYSADYEAASVLEKFLESGGFITLSTNLTQILSLAAYVLTAYSLYTIAKRRGISNPWLAWIPVVDVWVLGSISDQYRYVVKGEFKSKRKALIPLRIISGILYVFMLAFAMMLFFAAAASSMSGPGMANMLEEAAPLPTIMLVVGVLGTGALLAYAILYFTALYDVYASCDPDNRVAFLVLSILFGFLKPLFLFLDRSKDNGMPPRRPDPVNYAPQQPAWQPTAPVQEPWEQENKDYL
ncbi:MAG: hypothetical protein U0L15_04200 [Oscillospiraceae bacterium]|nr:hypothetical protein [Oscillospiraceae bacterium]